MATELGDSLRSAINSAIATEVQSIINEEIELAKEKIEARIREATASVALNVSKYYNLEMDTNRVIITVNTKDLTL